MGCQLIKIFLKISERVMNSVSDAIFIKFPLLKLVEFPLHFCFPSATTIIFPCSIPSTRPMVDISIFIFI
uniref:Uncharacterized protein n=1 Tax=Rhizophora mucronata TaxID=61149 RepID=A0A2P2R2Z0_RHIMU